MLRDTPVRIVLAPVASTIWHESGRLCGATDLPLGEEGARACQCAAEDLEDQIDLILTAEDEASAETAKRLAAPTNAKVKRIDALREIDMGLWEGMLHADVEAKFPSVYKQWKHDPISIVPPEGEPPADAERRLLDAIIKVIDKLRPDQRTVAIVLKPYVMRIVRRAVNPVLNGSGPIDETSDSIDGINLTPSAFSELKARAKALKTAAAAGAA